MRFTGYAEVPVTGPLDVQRALNRLPLRGGEVRKAVLLVWFDADSQPELPGADYADYVEVRDGDTPLDARP